MASDTAGSGSVVFDKGWRASCREGRVALLDAGKSGTRGNPDSVDKLCSVDIRCDFVRADNDCGGLAFAPKTTGLSHDWGKLNSVPRLAQPMVILREKGEGPNERTTTGFVAGGLPLDLGFSPYEAHHVFEVPCSFIGGQRSMMP